MNVSGLSWNARAGLREVSMALETSGSSSFGEQSKACSQSLNVRNHALTNAGNDMLLNRCCASLKRNCFGKSKNRVLTIGESTFFNIHQDPLGCYARNSKCRICALTIGEETIFEISALQLV